MIKLVAIDFDDTLSLTEEATFNIENQVIGKMGFPPMTRKAHQDSWGVPLGEAIVQRVPGINPDEFLKEIGKVLPDFVADGLLDVVDEKNIETLKKLKSKNMKLVILTSRGMFEVKHLLDESHHLNKYIDKIYHKDNTKYVKPDPKVFDQIFKDFDVLPSETVYLGDSLGDGIAAKGAGTHFIAVLESGLRKKEDFDSIPVDYFVDRFPDCINYINSIK